jgi:hypothetical protein
MMKKIVCVLFFVFFLMSCYRTKNRKQFVDSLNTVYHLNILKNGMTKTEVLRAVKKPDQIDTIGNTIGPDSSVSSLEQWFYGGDQTLLFRDDTLITIDLDKAASDAELKHIMDSAKNAQH